MADLIDEDALNREKRIIKLEVQIENTMETIEKLKDVVDILKENIANTKELKLALIKVKKHVVLMSKEIAALKSKVKNLETNGTMNPDDDVIKDDKLIKVVQAAVYSILGAALGLIISYVETML